jgi:minor extracellular serine protease Vpr
MKRSLVFVLFFLIIFSASTPLFSARPGTGRYALILSEPPVAQRFVSRREMRTAAAVSYRQRIQAAQAGLRRELERRNVRVTGSVQSLLNAVFVQASEQQAVEFRNLPGVQGVAPLSRMHRTLNKAVPLVNGPAAWTVLGGVQNAGTGMKIAIIDTGIDQTHPAFQDDSLPIPAGFPKCQPQDCAFTNHKVIVARSYVAQLGAGTPPNPAADSRPDDNSPRDHVGHGTALAMVSAGLTNTGPAATITGMAPQAYLGSYKIFGSPGVNDGTSGDIVILALEDALNDGMDIAVLSLGAPAFSGPLDQGPICGASPSTPCDPEAVAVENAVLAGMSVAVAAGNEGDTGLQVPTLNTISSPADAPSAIAVAGTTNSHTFVNSVRVPGAGVPSNLQVLEAEFGDGPVPASPLTAPLRDVSQLGNNGLACSALPASSLSGAIALIQRGVCLFSVKVTNASNAGAVGVLLYNLSGVDSIFPPGGLSGTSIPAVLIGNTDGTALKSYLSSHSNTMVTLDPGLTEVDLSTFDTMASFSSRGPSAGFAPVKPEVGAVATDMYMATQDYDPSGDMYSGTRYIAADGTSFSTPMVAGALALTKQKNTGFTPAQLKSAVVNTASQGITDGGFPADFLDIGAGKLNAGLAVQTAVTVEPATVSFGLLGSGVLPLQQKMLVTNTGAGSLNLALTVVGGSTGGVQLTLDHTSLSLNAGQSATVTATLSGNVPSPGVYEPAITVQGGGANLLVPCLYLVGDGIPFNMIPLIGSGFEGPVGESTTEGAIAFKLIDQFGVPIQGAPVAFGATIGGGSIQNADSQTDAYGIAGAGVILGSNPGAQEFAAQVGGLTLPFDGIARLKPTISASGVVNAASFQVGPGVAPGSYISIFGTGLSDDTQSEITPYLPVSLGGVSVSFDVPSANLSLPGRLYFISPGQVNIQVPWELQGQSSAQMKVSIGGVSGGLYTVPLSDYAPAVFEYSEPSTNQRLAAALDSNSNLIGSSNAARHGDTIQIYANGLGPVDNQPATGQASPQQPLSRTKAAPTVTIGGQNAAVSFSGLAPLYSGLYQLNVVVPPGTPSGIQPLVVTVNGVTAKSVSLPVQ